MKDRTDKNDKRAARDPRIEVAEQIRAFARSLAKDSDMDRVIAAAEWVKILDQAIESGEIPLKEAA